MKLKAGLCCGSFALLVLVHLALLTPPASGRPLCDGGEVIWYQGESVGCVFKRWGEAEKGMCKGAKVLSPRPADPLFGSTCHVCVLEKFEAWVKTREHWPKLKVGVVEASARPASFSCLRPFETSHHEIETSPRFQLHLEQPLCSWTPWLNRDTPGGSGDYETLRDFVAAGKACAEPEKVECRRRDGRPIAETGEIVTCNEDSGLYCLNRQQMEGRRCSDYEVRFCCAPVPSR